MGLLMLLFLAAGAPVFGADAIKLKVTAELANIRLKPSIGSVIIRQIPQGEILEAVRQEGEWYLVKIEPDESGAATGYVHESLVMPLEEGSRPDRKIKAEEPAAKKQERQRTEPPAAETGAEGERTSAGWSFSISGGGNYTLAGYLNSAAQGLADYLGDQSALDADKLVSPAHMSFMFGGEFGIPLLSWLQLAIGADFYSSTKSSLLTYGSGSASPTFSAKPSFQAVPISAALKIYPLDSFYLKLGATFFVANCGYYYRYDSALYWQEWEGTAHVAALGLCGGLGYEKSISGSFSLIVEVLGQYAPLTEFKGTGTYQDSTMAEPTSEDGKLWAYDASVKNKTVFPLLLVRSQKPTEAYVENVRAATIDFSGLSLRVGIKIKL
jgi:hypothetical protein